MQSDPVVIIDGARTPMGGFQGVLSPVTATQLGSTAIEAALHRAGLPPAEVQQVIMGCVLPGGLRQGPARQAALGAGIPVKAGCVTVNKLCGSGMQALIFAHDQLLAGSCEVAVAGGMESMSNAPYLLPKARGGMRLGHGEVLDHMFTDGLEDAETGRLMGSFAQEVADRYGLSRGAMDEFAVQSLTRARRAIESRALEPETAPVTVKTRKGEQQVVDDEQPMTADFDKIPKLRPAFAKEGTITAANSSSISDGASALLLMRQSEAERRGLTPRARIVAHATNSRHPSEFTIAPIGAIEKVLAKAGWGRQEVDRYEINEAFAMVTMLASSELGLDPAHVNVFGGACAQGHPVGSTGSRIVVTLLNALTQADVPRGVAALCIGGGEATAVAIERI